MVRLLGIEPRTSGSTIRRSNQLSYNRTLRGKRRSIDARGLVPSGDASIRANGGEFKTVAKPQAGRIAAT